MEITFSLPHVFSPTASQAEDAEALRLLLESLIALNRVYLRNHAVKSLYRSGVVYGRTTVWDTIPALYKRRYGDCKSLSAALIAEMREQGIKCQPVFRFTKRVDGHKDFHILVARDGDPKSLWEDPSKKLGMGQNENKWFR